MWLSAIEYRMVFVITRLPSPFFNNGLLNEHLITARCWANCRGRVRSRGESK